MNMNEIHSRNDYEYKLQVVKHYGKENCKYRIGSSIGSGTISKGVHTALAKSKTLPPPLAALQTTLLFATEGSI